MENTENTAGNGARTVVWTPEYESTLVQALIKAKHEGKWGDNNPKPVAWTACVTALFRISRTDYGKSF